MRFPEEVRRLQQGSEEAVAGGGGGGGCRQAAGDHVGRGVADCGGLRRCAAGLGVPDCEVAQVDGVPGAGARFRSHDGTEGAGRGDGRGAARGRRHGVRVESVGAGREIEELDDRDVIHVSPTRSVGPWARVLREERGRNEQAATARDSDQQ